MAVRPKALVCSYLNAVIANSNPVDDMDVHLLYIFGVVKVAASAKN